MYWSNHYAILSIYLNLHFQIWLGTVNSDGIRQNEVLFETNYNRYYSLDRNMLNSHLDSCCIWVDSRSKDGLNPLI